MAVGFLKLEALKANTKPTKLLRDSARQTRHKKFQASRLRQKKTRKVDLKMKIFIWLIGHQPERQKKKGSREDKTVTSVLLSLVKPDWPGYILSVDNVLNS